MSVQRDAQTDISLDRQTEAQAEGQTDMTMISTQKSPQGNRMVDRHKET